MIYRKKTEIYISSNLVLSCQYNRLYIRGEKNLKNVSNEIRYIQSNEIKVENMKLQFNPEVSLLGINYVLFTNNNKNKTLLKKGDIISVNGSLKLTIELDPGATFINVPMFSLVENNEEETRKNEVGKQGMLIKVDTESVDIDTGAKSIIEKTMLPTLDIASKNIKEVKQSVEQVKKSVEHVKQSSVINEYQYNMLMYSIHYDRIQKMKKQLSLGNNIFVISDNFTRFNIPTRYNIIDLERTDITFLEDLLREETNFLDVKFCFIESAWLGENNTWRNKVCRITDELKAVIRIMKSNGIKVVFFNKEDPVHFDMFKHVSYYVDFVFTTSQECLSKYGKISKAKTFVQPYFVDEHKYNYFRTEHPEKINTILYAGSWYDRFQERNIFLKECCESMDIDIYDRNYLVNSKFNQFPFHMKKYIKGGGLKSEEVINLLSEYKYVLSLNSVTNSSTMIARRVFEMIALGKIQISNYSLALENLKEYPIVYTENNSIEEIKKLVKNNRYSDKDVIMSSYDILLKNSSESFFNKLEELCGHKPKANMNVLIKVSNIEDFETYMHYYSMQTKQNNNVIIDCDEQLISEIEKTEYFRNFEIYFECKNDLPNVIFNRFTYNEEFLMLCYISAAAKPGVNFLFKEFDERSAYKIEDCNEKHLVANDTNETIIINMNVYDKVDLVVRRNNLSYIDQFKINRMIASDIEEMEIAIDEKMQFSIPLICKTVKHYNTETLVVELDKIDTKIEGVFSKFCTNSCFKDGGEVKYSQIVQQINKRKKHKNTKSNNNRKVIFYLIEKLPDANNIYANQFSIAQIRSLEASGYTVIPCVSKEENYVYAYEELAIYCLSEAKFKEIISNFEKPNIMIGFYNAKLGKYVEGVDAKIIISTLGFEVNDYDDRSFLTECPYNKLSVERYKEIFSTRLDEGLRAIYSKDYYYTFPSIELKNVYEKNVGEAKNYFYLPTPIDTREFNISNQKKLGKKIKVLYIASFASNVYASDILVAFIMELSKRSCFGDFEFEIYGDGGLYDQVMEPLIEANFKNVHLIRSFVLPEEIKSKHKENDIYLNLKRCDSQGVSRMEAMASGLLVVENALPTVFEFSEDNCTVVCELTAESLVNVFVNLDRTKIKGIGKNASRFIVDNFSFESIADMYEKVGFLHTKEKSKK